MTKSGVCLNSGCYEDAREDSDYCSEKCRLADKRRRQKDWEVKTKIFESSKIKLRFASQRGENPGCSRPGCTNLVGWTAGHWATFCSRKCSIAEHRNFVRSK